MFNSLTGNITGHRFPFLYLSTGGVEWQIEVSSHTFQSCMKQEDICRILVHLYVRENILHMYGFENDSERTMFLQIVKVSGIGPKQALNILSSVRIDQLVEMLEKKDTQGLQSIKGLGLKTAQKMILQLEGQLAVMSSRKSGNIQDDLHKALVDMGFNSERAAQALSTVKTRIANTSESSNGGVVYEQEVLRQAIITLTELS